MCMCFNTCEHIYMYMYIYICIYAYMYILWDICVHILRYTEIDPSAYVYIKLYSYRYIYICTYTGLYICTDMQTNEHTHILSAMY